MNTAHWTRRRVLQSMGVAAAAAPLPNLPALSQVPEQGARLYLLKSSDAESSAGIQVLFRDEEAWREQQFLAKPHAAVMLADLSGGHLYVAHRADPATGWPAGCVESYRIDRRSGLLTHRATQSLALSARRPLKIALNSNPSVLVVAAAGGVFSLLPIQGDGELRPLTMARKDLDFSDSSDDEFASCFKRVSRQMIGSFYES